MKNEGMRDKFENVGREYVRMLFDEINRRYPNTTITDITIPEDPYTSYDMTATINGNIYYIENKTRGKSYDYFKLKDKGFLLRVIIALMETNRWLIKHVEHTLKTRTNLSSQTNTLRLATR